MAKNLVYAALTSVEFIVQVNVVLFIQARVSEVKLKVTTIYPYTLTSIQSSTIYTMVYKEVHRDQNLTTAKVDIQRQKCNAGYLTPCSLCCSPLPRRTT